jgi:saccharopine dehydrogenase (NADP+, L-glutamate forming)
MAAALQALFPMLGLSKKVLLLGAGFVTKPTVQILSDAGVDVTVGSSMS